MITAAVCVLLLGQIGPWVAPNSVTPGPYGPPGVAPSPAPAASAGQTLPQGPAPTGATAPGATGQPSPTGGLLGSGLGPNPTPAPATSPLALPSVAGGVPQTGTGAAGTPATRPVQETPPAATPGQPSLGTGYSFGTVPPTTPFPRAASPYMPSSPLGAPMAPPAAYGSVVPTGPAGIGAAPRMSVATFGSPVGPAPTIAAQKPGANYRQPPAVSPYINLFRSNGLVGVNNYYSLVRPMLEQQAFNQQTQANLQNLEFNNRLQQMQMQQMQQQQNQMLQKPSGNYFMNYYQFYPGLGR